MAMAVRRNNAPPSLLPDEPPEDKTAGPVRPRGFVADLILRFFFFQIQILKVLVICALVFLLVGIVGYRVVEHRVRSTEVAVPNIAGYPFDAAAQLFHEKGLDLGLRIEGTEFSDFAQPGEILSQFPRSDSFVKAGSVVRVRISAGSARVACPDLRGANDLQAGIDLRAADLAEGERSFVHAPDAAGESVMAQHPPPGSPLLRGSKVDLLVSLGARRPQYLMPDLVGMSRFEAEEVLASSSLKVAGATEEWQAGFANGAICRQDPPTGSVVSADSPVHLTIARNPAGWQ